MSNYDNSVTMTEQVILKIIIKRMKEKNFTQLALANEVGVNQSTLSRNLRGTTKFTIDTFFKVLNALDIDLSVPTE